jgi:hypothetical protein
VDDADFGPGDLSHPQGSAAQAIKETAANRRGKVMRGTFNTNRGRPREPAPPWPTPLMTRKGFGKHGHAVVYPPEPWSTQPPFANTGNDPSAHPPTDPAHPRQSLHCYLPSNRTKGLRPAEHGQTFGNHRSANLLLPIGWALSKRSRQHATGRDPTRTSWDLFRESRKQPRPSASSLVLFAVIHTLSALTARPERSWHEPTTRHPEVSAVCFNDGSMFIRSRPPS